MYNEKTQTNILNDAKEIKFNVTLFNKTGEVIPESDSEGGTPTSDAFAKSLDYEDGNSFYYVLVYDGLLFDPMGPNAKTKTSRRLETKMKRVSKHTFDMYVTYLKTNNSVYLTKAQRGFLND